MALMALSLDVAPLRMICFLGAIDAVEEGLDEAF